MTKTGTAVEPPLPRQLFTFALFREVPSADHGLVLAASRVATFDTGDAIYRQGAPSRALAVVVDGRVKLSVLSAHGKELVVSLLGPRQTFGEIGFLDGQPRSLDATAVESSRVLLVERTALLGIMARTPAMALAFAEATCKRLRRTTTAVQQAVFYGTEERLADCVLRLAAAAEQPGGAMSVWQHELAAMVGVSRESVNKHLRSWHTRNLIRLGRGRITVIDAAELCRIAAPTTAPG